MPKLHSETRTVSFTSLVRWNCDQSMRGFRSALSSGRVTRWANRWCSCNNDTRCQATQRGRHR